MAITSETRINGPYTGDGVQTTFAFTFRVFVAGDVAVSTKTPTGIVTLLTLGSDYTVSLNSDQTTSPGGSITLTAGPLSVAHQLVIESRVPYTQPTVLLNAGPFLPKVLEYTYDRAVAQVQQLRESSRRTIRVDGFSGALNPMTAEPGKFIAFDGAGQPIASAGTGADIGLRTDLAAITGSSLVNWRVGGSGDVVRTVQAKLRDVLTVEDFGAVGDGATSDALPFARTLTFIGTFGGRLQLRTRTYQLTDHDSDGACIRISTPIILQGGGFYGALRPDPSVPVTTSTIRYWPVAGADHTNSVIENLQLGDYATGTRPGSVGLSCYTAPGTLLPGLIVRNVAIQAATHTTAKGLVLANDPANPTGGIYCSVVEYNAIKGGVVFDSVGDNIVTRGNIVTGNHIGMDITLITGATGPFHYDDNITSNNGAYRLRRGLRTAFINPNYELKSTGNAATTNEGFVVNLANESGTNIAGYMLGGCVIAETGAVTTGNLRVKNVNGFTVFNTTFLDGNSGRVGIRIENDATNTRVFGCSFNNGFPTLSAMIDDKGIGTMGVPQIIAAQDGTDFDPNGKARFRNGWVSHSTTEAAQYFKCPASGLITLLGDISSGTTAADTLLFRLPSGFRPSGVTITRIVDTFNGTVWSKATLTIHGVGSSNPGWVTVTNAQSNRLCLSGVTFLAHLGAHTTSYE